MNYIMENHGYDVMDLVEEIKYEKQKYEFALKCKQQWYNLNYFKMQQFYP